VVVVEWVVEDAAGGVVAVVMAVCPLAGALRGCCPRSAAWLWGYHLLYRAVCSKVGTCVV